MEMSKLIKLGEVAGYKLHFNGSATYYITDDTGDCLGHYPTKRRATNALKKILQGAGKI